MKDLLKKPVTFEKVEFWIATAIYVFSVYVLAYNQYVQIMMGDLHTPNVYLFREHSMPYSYSKDYFIPQFFINTTFYCSFLLLNFWIVKPLIKGERIFLNVIKFGVVALLTVVIFGTAETWIKSYLFYNHSEYYLYRLVFKQEAVFCIWALITFGVYTLAKTGISMVFLNYKGAFHTYPQITKECIIALALSALWVIFLTMVHVNLQVSLIWLEIMLFAIGLYWYSFHTLIPNVLADNQEFGAFLARIIVLLAISVVPVSIFFYAATHRLENGLIISLFNAGVCLFIVAPVSWFLYKHRLSKNNELTGLKTALGSSSANLDFLRSQINPHFLFNALNTLYGTSLQENAERTGEGIQKLGDMMRFMLQENMQEKIALAREIDYLNNYIDLQKLRTQTSPDIIIQTEIDEQTNTLQIAPMLLIPFVENAFKHGISLREPSHIKISLQTRENELLFDVYNSIHPKAGNDPEKNKSGIGLENVKQRLLLLYPKRHELVIRESAKEFFIHLTVQL
jgi:two-component system LytT family sensor kinase